MWAVKPGANRPNTYAVRVDYDPDNRLVPLATKPPPMPTALKRKRPQQPSSVPSPYSVAAGYDPANRRIPVSSAPPQPRMPPRRQAVSRQGGMSPRPPAGPPPRHVAMQAHVVRHSPVIPQYAQQFAEPEPLQEPPAPPLRLSLPPGAMFVADGLVEEGAAIYFDSRLSELTSCVSHVLRDLVEDPASEVVLEHDANWEQFPEIGEALLEAGGSEASMCVAICSSLGVWGVGVGGKWQKREACAKLALCVALLEKLDNCDEIAEQYPGFVEFCQVQKPSRKKRRGKAVSKAKAKAIQAKREPVEPPPPVAPASEGFPKDEPIWIRLPDDDIMPEELDGLLPEALALGSDGTKRKALYTNADKVIAELVADPEADIEYVDDSDWSKFPTIGAALKEVAEKEECLCVAICRARSAWAVGVGMKGKPRFQAAKVALAASMLWQASEGGEDMPELECTAMLDFVEEVRQARQEIGW